MDFPDLPPIDAHAHLATDVTAAQVRHLGKALVFAMTRSLSEAASVPFGCYDTLIWGVGVHPGDQDALERYSGERFEALLPRFALVGEVGLDRRSGHFARQQEVLADILTRTANNPVVVSLHSTGAVGEVVSLLEEHRIRVPILHWFGGTADDAHRAVEIGGWFSVNGAMKDETLIFIPRNRVITETDFPYTRRVGSTHPGATVPAERNLARMWGCTVEEVRGTVWENFKTLVTVSGVRPRLTRHVQELV